MASNIEDLEEKKPSKIKFLIDTVQNDIVPAFTDRDKKKIGFILSLFFLGILIGGYAAESFYSARGIILKTSLNPFMMFYYFFNPLGFLTGIISWAVMFWAYYYYKKVILENRPGMDTTRNYAISAKGTFGTAHFMTEEEERVAFDRSKNINTFYGDILGMDDYGYLVSRKEKPFTNRNVAIIGASGSGKSVSLIIPDVLQNIRRGNSCIVTDTKGDIYAQTHILAEKCGYTVKVLDLKPHDIIYSDAINFMKIIRGSDLIAETVATCIMINTNEGKKQDFWYEGELNLLKSIILFVDRSEDYDEKDKTLDTVYDLIANNDLESLELKFENLPKTHPAFQPFQIFKNGTDTVKQSSLSGLGIRLSILANSLVKQIIKHDDIDLRLPGTQKCLYYCIFSDQTKQFKFLSALFFSELFIELIDLADARDDEALPVQTNFIIDEFKACGAIPEFDDKISTVRSRNIGVKFVVQDMTQLMRMYPDKAHVTILNNCTTQMLLNSTDEGDTIKHFVALAGTQTVKTQSESYGEAKTQLFKWHNQRNLGNGESQRNLMNVDEIVHMPRDKMLVCISGEPGVILLTKQPYYSDYPGSKYKEYSSYDNKYHYPHPMKKFMKKEVVSKRITSWRKEYEEEMEKLKGKSYKKPENPLDTSENNNKPKNKSKRPNSPYRPRH